MKPYYENSEFGIQLFQGDCLEVLPLLAPGSVDAVVTDPPYCSGGYTEASKNTGSQGLRSATVQAEDFVWFPNDNMTTGGLVWLLRSVMVEASRFCAQNRSCFIFTDWRMVPHLAPALESSGFRYRNMIVWDKGNGGLGCGFKPAHEIVLEFTNGVTEYQTRNGQNILRSSRVPSSHREHKTQKPVELMEQIPKVAVAEGGLVLDPFMGSGSTGVACVNIGRRFIGIEKEAQYAAIAQDRIEKAIAAKQRPKQRELLETAP